jgi:hypothetical protein
MYARRGETMSIRDNEIEVRVRVRCAWKRTPCDVTAETWAAAYPLSRESEAFGLMVPAPEGWRDTDDGIMCPEHAASRIGARREG